jgi:hypothetical protein
VTGKRLKRKDLTGYQQLSVNAESHYNLAVKLMKKGKYKRANVHATLAVAKQLECIETSMYRLRD